VKKLSITRLGYFNNQQRLISFNGIFLFQISWLLFQISWLLFQKHWKKLRHTDAVVDEKKNKIAKIPKETIIKSTTLYIPKLFFFIV